MHEARHTYASLMIAAGVNAKALSTYMGHASITITLDRYGHLFPGAEDEAAGLMVLLNAREQLTEADGTFRVTAASQPVTRILEIAMLADELLDAPEVGHPDGAVPPLA